MALSALQASQLSALLAGHAKMFTANNPGQNEFADYLLKSGQSATMGLLAEEEEKKRKKAQKGGLFGKLGSALGSAAGITLAHATGGASLAAAGAIGGGLGGLAGQYLGGGSPTLGGFALDAAQGGLSGYTYGKAGDLANNVQTSGVATDIPGSPPIGQNITEGIANAIPNANTLSTGPMAAFGQGRGVFPQAMQQNMPPMRPGLSPIPNPGVAGVTQAAQRTRPSFFGALNHVMNPQPMRPQGKLIRKLPDGTEIYE